MHYYLLSQSLPSIIEILLLIAVITGFLVILTRPETKKTLRGWMRDIALFFGTVYRTAATPSDDAAAQRKKKDDAIELLLLQGCMNISDLAGHSKPESIAEKLAQRVLAVIRTEPSLDGLIKVCRPLYLLGRPESVTLIQSPQHFNEKDYAKAAYDQVILAACVENYLAGLLKPESQEAAILAQMSERYKDNQDGLKMLKNSCFEKYITLKPEVMKMIKLPEAPESIMADQLFNDLEKVTLELILKTFPRLTSEKIAELIIQAIFKLCKLRVHPDTMVSFLTNLQLMQQPDDAIITRQTKVVKLVYSKFREPASLEIMLKWIQQFVQHSDSQSSLEVLRASSFGEPLTKALGSGATVRALKSSHLKEEAEIEFKKEAV